MGTQRRGGGRRGDGQSREDKALEKFEAADVDVSGALTFDEYIANCEAKATEKFNAADTDGNQELNFEEFLAGMKSGKKGKKRGGRRGMGGNEEDGNEDDGIDI